MSTTKPRVSVGMPAYNAEATIAEAIESILNQSYVDFELIIADNASTDRTLDICRRYASQDPRIRLVENGENIGVGANYDKVFHLSATPYFKWASANDLCHENLLESCIQILDQDQGAVLAYPRTIFFEDSVEDGREHDDYIGLDHDEAVTRFINFIRRARYNNYMNGVIRSDALRRVPLTKRFLSSDMVMMAALVLRGRFEEVPERYFYRRMDAKSMAAKTSLKEQVRHFDPELKHWMLFQQCRLDLAFLGVAVKAPVRIRDKLTLCREVLRRMFLRRELLFWDAVLSVRSILGGKRTRY